MTATSRRCRATTVLTSALVALAVVTLGVSRTTTAGFSANTNTGGGWETGQVVLTDDDAGVAMFTTGTNGLLDGGQSLTRCLAVTYAGTFTDNVGVRLHGTASGALAPYLTLNVEEGSGGGAGTCTGFVPGTTLYNGDLAAFAAERTSFSTGLSTWAISGTPETRTYRVTLTVQNVPAAQARSATGTFTWEAATLPPWTPADLTGSSTLLRAKDAGAVSTPVSAWTDKVTNTIYAGPGTNPTVVASAPNGGKAVRFTAATKPMYPATQPNVFDSGASDAESITSSPWFGGNSMSYAPATIAGSAGNWATDSNTGPLWWQVKLKTPKAVTGYTLTAVNSNGRNPKDWQFQGSPDGTSWTILDTRTGVTTAITNVTYPFANSTAYRYYRLNITAINGGDLAYLTRIALTGANIGMTQPAEAEIWIVAKANVPANTGNGHPWRLDASDNYYPFSDNRIYDGFGGYRAVTTPVSSILSWRLYRATISATEYRRYVDGTQRFGAAGTARAFLRVPSFGGPFQGDIAEIYVRKQISNPAETARLITYFNTQHGLSAPGGS